MLPGMNALRGLTRRRFSATMALACAAAAFPRSLQALEGDPAPGSDVPARDPDRPACHLLPPHNWMNDPNGPIWWKGQYHLFYQLNPHAAVWGDMHWGHAVSPDMIHWRHEPIALAPTPGGPDSEGCFSGSAVVFNGKPAFIYTGVQNAPPNEVTIHDGNDKLRETQLLAVAEDDQLLHWKKDPQPIIPTPPPGMNVTGFRDPCPWREGDTWYCAIGSGERGVGGGVLLYRSPDLRHWEYLHKLTQGKPNGLHTANPCDSGEMWECPDFFPLPLLGSNQVHHCLLYSTENKVIWTTGHYDPQAHTYTPARTGVLDHGAYYAPKSFLAPGGRRILWGWVQEKRPEAEFSAAGWAGSMSYPRELSIGAQGQLQMHPAHEVEKLRGPSEHAAVTTATPFRRKLDTLQRELHLRMNLLSDTVATIRLIAADLPAWELTLDVPAKQVRCGDIAFPFPGLPWPHPDLRLLLDGSVIESFIADREALTSRVYGLQPGATDLELVVQGRHAIALQMWPLVPISHDRLTT
jgi:beta-fructofuranosidase